MTSPTTGYIRVTRARALWRDRLSGYGIEVDGVRVGVVAQGRYAEFEVAAGARVVRATSNPRVFRSPDVSITVPPGGTVSMACRARGPAILSFLLLLFPNRYLDLVVV